MCKSRDEKLLLISAKSYMKFVNKLCFKDILHLGESFCRFVELVMKCVAIL